MEMAGLMLAPGPQATVRERFEQQIAIGYASEVERCAAGAAVAALGGGLERGRTMLRDALTAEACRPPLQGGPLLTVVLAALVCGELDAVSDLLTCAAGPEISVRVSVVERVGQVSRAGMVGCVIGRPGELRFELPRPLFAAPGFLTLVNRWITCLPLLAQGARVARPRTGRVRLQLIDGAFRPGLGFCARVDAVTLIPDPDFLRSHGYQAQRDHMREQGLPWSARQPVALWRGSPNGHPGPGQDWRSLARVRLCTVARDQAPGLIDAALTSPLPKNHAGHSALMQSGLMGPHIETRDFQKYRYQIDIDGYTNAWSGLFTKLLTGSTVLKVQSGDGWRQWYYDLLQPWTHFVPVAADLGDLVEKVRWLVDHDERAQEIGAAGRALAESLTYERQVEWAAGVIARSLS